MSRRLVPIVVLSCTSLALVACKGGRRKLEQLVPDGATGMVSMDAKALLKTDVYAKAKESAKAMDPSAEADAVLTKARDDCGLDFETLETVVVGFDAISQNVMGAVRMPNVGKLEALRCFDELARAQGGSPQWEIGETDGKASLTVADGEAQGWAMDDDTLVFSSKGWASAVQSRMKGESKGAIDNNLSEAVALADRGKHVWFAGEVPAIMESFLVDTPAKGLRRGAGSIHYGEGLEVAVAVELADEDSAKALDAVIKPQLEVVKKGAVAQGMPQEAVDSIEIEVDGAVIKGKVVVPMDALLETTTGAFSKYMNRSKTSEARIQLAKMSDAASAYFNEEHVQRGAVDVIGGGGGIADIAPHACPNDGRTEGEAGMTPPLSVKCSEGPGGRCVPSVDGKDAGPGYYDIAKFTDNPVWNGLNFQQEQAHYFHYNFRWKNDPSGFGNCQFTAQAFGDLDGDGVYSTYERSGAADENGVNMAAGLYIDRELE